MENKENVEDNTPVKMKSQLKVKILPLKDEKANADVKEDTKDEERENDNNDSCDDKIDDHEEPVSPPPCSPSEAPQLLMSQTIEDLAMEVVDQNRNSPPRTDGTSDTFVLPATVSAPRVDSGPSLIPLTVDEVLAKPGDLGHPSNIHMSGGGVYTTDSFFANFSKSTVAKAAKKSQSIAASVIKKAPKTDSQQSSLEMLLRQKFPREAREIVKLPSSLEITPILTKHMNQQSHTKEVRKRKFPDESVECGNAKSKSDLVITKIPRIESHKTQEGGIGNCDMLFDCKLLVSPNDKKVKLVFENGLQMFLNKSIFNNLEFEKAAEAETSQKMRRKSKKSKPVVSVEKQLDINEDSHKDKDGETKVEKESEKQIPPHIPVTHKLPLIVTKPTNSYLQFKSAKLKNK